FHFLPCNRNRYSHAWSGSQRPRGYGGRAKTIAQIIDEDCPDPVPRTAFCRKTPGKHFCHVLYHGLGKAFHRVPVVAANNGHYHVQALATAGLQESGQFELLKEVAQKDGSLLHGLPFHTFTRVQVKGNSVRSVDTAAYRIPGVKLYGVQLGSLGKAQGVA